jgi:hypothetical protein
MSSFHNVVVKVSSFINEVNYLLTLDTFRLHESAVNEQDSIVIPSLTSQSATIQWQGTQFHSVHFADN